MNNLGESLLYFSPELILTVFAVMTLIADSMLPKWESWKSMFIAFLGVSTASVAAMILYRLFPGDISIQIFSGQLSINQFSLLFKLIILVSTAIVFLYAPQNREFFGRRVGEYYMLMITAAIGMCMMVSSNTLLMFYLSLEMMSLSSYLLVGYLKHDRRSAEASIKYLIFGAVSSGITLYGISLLFGLTGTGDLSQMGRILTEMKTVVPDGGVIGKGDVGIIAVVQNHYGIWLAITMILSGVAYKISVFPFHFWAPDAYEGAPTPVAAFLSVASKAAGVGFLIRFISMVIVPMYQPVMHGDEWATVQGAELWPYIFAVIAVCTMFLGNLAAIWQEDVKRMLAYSSIAHAGYMMVGIAVATNAGINRIGMINPEAAGYDSQGFTAVVFYIMIYAFMNIGAFLVAMIVINHEGGCKLEHFKGLVYRAPHLAIAMVIFLFALAGLPPTGGFIGKFYIFKAAIMQGWYVLTILGLVSSVISLYFYARIIRAMTFEKASSDREIHAAPLNRVVMGVCLIPIIALGLYWWPVYQWAQSSFTNW